MRAAALLALVAAAALAVAAGAHGARIAVGIEAGASPDAVAAAIEAATGGAVDRTLEPIDAVVVQVEDAEAALAALAGVPGISYLERILPHARSLAFLPNDPLLFRQWYVGSIFAFDFWETRPELAVVKVAVIDSGIDVSHPEFAGRIAATKSFVRGKATVDSLGHGTMVAGLIAAAVDNGEGIAGVGFPVQLVVAKVVGPGGGITVEAEAKAIRWAVDQGARVINLSLGGHRDPRRRDPKNPPFDTFSPLEQAAIEYAYSRGAVIVAATGNCISPCPYRFASYPAALAHVVGVSALDQRDATPAFSNRDTVYNDLAAPGVGIVSTFPGALTEPGCLEGAYSICARSSLRAGNGTSFAAPLAAAAAALLIATRPSLRADQVMALLGQTALDLGKPGRDALTGYGRLHVQRALAAIAEHAVPPRDRFETNDDVGGRSHTLPKRRRVIDFEATIDFFDDPSDVYRIRLRAGERLIARLRGLPGRPTLVLWRPETKVVREITVLTLRSGDVLAHRVGRTPRFAFRAPRTGWYYLEVKAPRRAPADSYRLVVVRR